MHDIAADSPPVPEPDPLAGTAYRTIRRIGAGAMGQVLEAEHTGLRRRVAVKLLSPALAGDPAFADRLRLEAQALASVRHPHVVAVHDHAITPGGAPFLVMELLHGRTLDALLQERGALALPEALRTLEQICRGLAAIHAAGLTHRDLKPANVFLCEEAGGATVKLIDLGIVKITRRDPALAIEPLRFPTEEGHVMGTPRCMAPEQVRGQPCDARTDVYAAGILLFLLLTGRDPFHHHRTHALILTAQVMEPPPLLSRVASQPIPPGLDRAVARALAKEPADRFASIEDFAAALRAVGGAEPAPAASRGGTEKISASTWGAGPPAAAPARTAPIDVSLFRAGRPAPPSAAPDAAKAPPGHAPGAKEPRDGAVRAGPRVPPSFGLPPPAPAPDGEAAGAPREPPRPPAEASPVAPEQDNRLLFAIVALLWCVVAAVAWRVL